MGVYLCFVANTVNSGWSNFELKFYSRFLLITVIKKYL